MQEIAWQIQQLFVPPADAAKSTATQAPPPPLTADALFVLVDTALVRIGIGGGVRRNEYDAALQALCLSGELIQNADARYFAARPPT